MLEAPELTRVVLQKTENPRGVNKSLLQIRVENVGKAREFGNLKKGKL